MLYTYVYASMSGIQDNVCYNVKLIQVYACTHAYCYSIGICVGMLLFYREPKCMKAIFLSSN